jgi:hypothetical protein
MKLCWRYIRTFGATSVFNTLAKGKRISNKNWNSDLRLEFGMNLVEFLEFDSNP